MLEIEIPANSTKL